jgi:hypothetical protein
MVFAPMIAAWVLEERQNAEASRHTTAEVVEYKENIAQGTATLPHATQLQQATSLHH